MEKTTKAEESAAREQKAQQEHRAEQAHRAEQVRKSEKSERQKMSRGGRNLVILGIGSTLIALLTTTIGLAIYHLSGDIYLDRSRPGYMPDEAEVEEEAEKEPAEYDFERSGTLTVVVLDEYSDHLQEEIEAIDNYIAPFDAGVLSDEQLLGLPEEED